MRLAVVGLGVTLLAASAFAVAFGAAESSQSVMPRPTASIRRPGEATQCQDTAPEMCDVWHKAGLCRSRGNQCQRTCGYCADAPGRVPRVPRTEACRRDNLTAAMPSGHLNAMFERLMHDFPQYRPVSLGAGCRRRGATRPANGLLALLLEFTSPWRGHSPMHPPCGDHPRPPRARPPQEALSRDPWIVQLHDVISDDEAQAFIDSCDGHFERSLAGDQLNPVSTPAGKGTGARFLSQYRINIERVHRRSAPAVRGSGFRGLYL